MNSGFEDVQCFMETLQKHGMDLSAAVPDFAKTREPTGNAIADLSMHNFVEMRSHTASKLFLLRKKIEGALNWAFPTSWVPLYKMVAFTRIPYDECIKREERQSCLLGVASTAALVTLATVPLALWLRGAPEKGAGDARGVALVRKIARAFREAAQ
jgi:kynurenine 3-monooxygenase